MSFPKYRIIQIAQVVHEAERAWQLVNGNKDYPTWDKASNAMKEKVANNVEFHIENPLAGDAGFHVRWLRTQEAEGWKWGKVKDEVQRTHPRMVPFHLLPPQDQARDRLFVAIVKALVRI